MVCSRINEGVEQDVRNKNKIINSFLSTDRQTNRENKSGARTVVKNT